MVVTPITANYTASTPTVTFKVSWEAGSRSENYRSKVWLLVDYRRIKNNAPAGDWQRAGIAGLPTVTAVPTGAASTVSGNTLGFWLQGSDVGDFAATVTVPVTVDLDGYAKQFGWCGVATDRPPTAEEKSAYYVLHGTRPFIIQTHPTNSSSTVKEETTAYNNCIFALTDATGCPGDPPPMPEITGFTAAPANICPGQSATLTATATNAGLYSFDDGATWQAGNTKVVKPSTTTTYILKATRTTGACTVTYSQTRTVTVSEDALPVITSLSSATVCAGTPATLTASATGAASYSIDNSAWQESATFTVNPVAATYTLYVKNAEGCIATLSNAATVTVNALPVITSQPANTTICKGGAATLSVVADNAAEYQWKDINGNDVTTGSGGNTGTYTTAPMDATISFWVEITNGACTVASSHAVVTVTDVLAMPYSGSSDARCGAGTVTFSATAPDGYTIDWYDAPTGGATVTGGYEVSSFTPSINETMTYYAQARHMATGCINATRLAVTATVHPNFTAGAITPASGTTTQGTDPGETVTNASSASGGDGTISYQWRRSGTSSATLTGAEATYTIGNDASNYAAAGTYYIERYAHDGSCNTEWTASTGAYTLTVAVPTPPPGAGTKTNTCGTQVWSEPVRISDCDKSSWTTSDTSPYCRSATYNDIKYFYYNWTYVNNNKNTMCPSPWRVPTDSDFSTLRYCLGTSITNGVYYPDSSPWGGALAGYSMGGYMYDTGSHGYYWSATDAAGGSAYALLFTDKNASRFNAIRSLGYQVRCVQ